jgi:hypothetical protein
MNCSYEEVLIDNERIWRSTSPREVIEHVIDGPELNMFVVLSKQKVFGPFFFVEDAVNSIVYLGMLVLEEFLVSFLEGEGPDVLVFQQDRAPPHFHKEVTWQGQACHVCTLFALPSFLDFFFFFFDRTCWEGEGMQWVLIFLIIFCN